MSTSAVMEEGNRQGKTYWKVELKRHRELLDVKLLPVISQSIPCPQGREHLNYLCSELL